MSSYVELIHLSTNEFLCGAYSSERSTARVKKHVEAGSPKQAGRPVKYL